MKFWKGELMSWREGGRGLQCVLCRLCQASLQRGGRGGLRVGDAVCGEVARVRGANTQHLAEITTSEANQQLRTDE